MTRLRPTDTRLHHSGRPPCRPWNTVAAARANRTLVLSLVGFALLSTASAPAQNHGGPHVIQAAAYVTTDGSIAAGGLLVITDEHITQVAGNAPPGASTDDYPGAVLCSGLIDCQAALGAAGNLGERQSAIQAHANARDAFNRYSRELRAALAAGVTTFALTPDDQNLIGGCVAVCQTAGPDGRPRLLTDTGPLKLSLSPAAFKVDREPTSRIGALGLLRETIESARAGGQGQRDPLAAFAAGQSPALLTAPSAADVLAALQLADEYGVKWILAHTTDARRVADQLGAATPRVTGLVVGPFDLTTGPRDAAAAGLFERQHVPVAIAGGLPGEPADSLRVGAAVAARAGLSPSAARRAITAVPASLLGVAERIGVLETGHQADVVVFSGDPLDLRSRVLAVYVAGRRVYVAEPNTTFGDQP